MNKLRLILPALLLSLIGYAQKDIGHFSGSFDMYSQYYMKDEKTGAVLPQDKIGSNNFLKLDYSYKKFTAGVQFEAYLPSIAGYPYAINDAKLINKYIRYDQQKFSLIVGDFYEQFGSGLVFRAWENRPIGINNAIQGVNLRLTPLKFLDLKVIYGRQRKVLDYASSNIRGIDANIDLSKIVKDNAKTKVTWGTSVVSRYQLYTGPDPSFPSTVNAISTRMDISGSATSLSLEYVNKGKDPHEANAYDQTSGEAFLSHFTYTKNNFGATFEFPCIGEHGLPGRKRRYAKCRPDELPARAYPPA